MPLPQQNPNGNKSLRVGFQHTVPSRSFFPTPPPGKYTSLGDTSTLTLFPHARATTRALLVICGSYALTFLVEILTMSIWQMRRKLLWLARGNGALRAALLVDGKNVVVRTTYPEAQYLMFTNRGF